MFAENRAGFSIEPRSPFAFDLILRYLRTSPSTIVETITADAWIRPIRLGERYVVVQVRDASFSSDSPLLEGSIVGESVGADEVVEVERIVRRTFAADADLADFEVVVDGDPIFREIVRRYRGLRPVLIPDLFETIVWAILGQQITVAFAAKCKRALVERYGARETIGGQSYLFFPRPEVLAEARDSDLAALQLSRQKIRYVTTIAREVASGALDLEALRALPPEAALERLQGIVGIGRWTAEYVLLRGLGHPDSIPAADGGLRRIIGRAYGLGRHASEEEVRRLAESWRGWRSYAAFYWWFALQQGSRDGTP